MYTIDLLKGQGIPVRITTQAMAIIAGAFALPIIIAIIMFGCFISDKIEISVQEQEIVNYEKNISKFADAVKLQQAFENEKKLCNDCLSEVGSNIGIYTQWSPILVTLVENLPDSVILTKLEVKNNSIKKSIPKKGEPGKKVDITVPVKTVLMNVSGSPNYNCDKDVRDFQDNLKFSSVLGPKLQNIRVSQKYDTLEGYEVVSYQIECTLKPQI